MIIEKFIIIDYKDKEANKFTFSANANIITAEKNTQGKSCLLKSLFYALGMGIKKFKPEWHIDSKIFKIYYKHKNELGYIIRQGDNFWVNNKNGRLNIKEYSQWLANKLKINMKLPMVKTLVYEPVYPSALILPYYIDQDTSWNKSIYKDVVLELGRYDSSAIPKKIFEYIFNISNDAIQEKEDELRIAKDEKAKAENQKKALDELKANFIKNSTVLSFDEEKAKDDIKKYLSYARTIQTKITTLQMKLFPKEKSLDENKLKVAELNELLRNNEEAYKNISKRCEYCHSELTREQSLSRFKLENDKFEIIAMKNDLLIKIEKLEKEINKILEEKIPLEEHYTELLKIANKKQQKYSLAEYIDEKAKKVNNDNYYQTENNVILKISQQEDILNNLKKVINALKKQEKENRDSITQEYKDLTASFSMKFPDVDFNRRTFLNFSQITDNSGATDNQEFFGLYMIYTHLLFNHSIVELPFGLDSTLKDELDDNNINKFYKVIEEIVLSNHNQSFVIMLKNKLSLLKNDYNVIELTKPILSKQKFEKLKPEFNIISEE